MKRIRTSIVLLIVVSVYFLEASSQNKYSDYRSIVQRIELLAKQNPSICSVKPIVKTAGGRDIYVISVGKGDKDAKPAIAVLGGIEARYMAGREIALGFAEKLVADSETADIKALLEKVTFYIFPDVSPDASEQFFAALRYERTENARSTDDDRDFSFDEDPFDDLNKDGLITLVRITDPAGTFVESEEDKRIMVPADLSKGETGLYKIITEGIDNDDDGKFNEDGTGGVIFNKNFTYNYEEYGANAGLHAMSEPESKALADFLYDHFNIYMTLAFGPQDNLGQPMKASERAASGQGAGTGTGRGQGMESGDRRQTAITRSDETINKLVSDKYHEITGAKGAPPVKSGAGNFMEWAYFHYGRYSFSTPAWWYPVDKVKNNEAAFLKFAEKNKLEDVFLPWTEIKHPGFPGKKAEIGGLKPYVTTTPPADTLPQLVAANYKFITAVAALHPELEFIDSIVENEGENIFRLTLKVHNKGIFASCAESGNNNLWTRIMRITLEPASDQTLLSGQKVQRITRLEGDGTAEYSWLIRGKGNLKVIAGALNTGTINATFELK